MRGDPAGEDGLIARAVDALFDLRRLPVALEAELADLLWLECNAAMLTQFWGFAEVKPSNFVRCLKSNVLLTRQTLTQNSCAIECATN